MSLEEGVGTREQGVAARLTLHSFVCVTCVLPWKLEFISPSYRWGR